MEIARGARNAVSHPAVAMGAFYSHRRSGADRAQRHAARSRWQNRRRRRDLCALFVRPAVCGAFSGRSEIRHRLSLARRQLAGGGLVLHRLHGADRRDGADAAGHARAVFRRRHRLYENRAGSGDGFQHSRARRDAFADDGAGRRCSNAWGHPHVGEKERGAIRRQPQTGINRPDVCCLLRAFGDLLSRRDSGVGLALFPDDRHNHSGAWPRHAMRGDPCMAGVL